MFKEEWVIYECLVGSHAYKLNTKDSDEDYRGILIPDHIYYISPFKKIEQYEDNVHDRVIYEFNKFISLASQNNPNILEMLYVDKELIKMITLEGDLLRKNRDLFLSAKVKFTYSGYAYAQMNRIKRHKRWIDNIPIKPDREKMGLEKDNKWFSNSVIHSLLDNFRNHTVGELTNKLCDTYNDLDKEKINILIGDIIYDIPKEYFKDFCIKFFCTLSKEIVTEENKNIIEKEFLYYVQKKEWDDYQQWISNRNLKRAELEKKYGYDTKHAKHLCRLLIQCEGILKQGILKLDMSNIEEIKKIQNGEWSYDYLLKWSEEKNNELDEIYKNKQYVVPHHPDLNKIESIFCDIVYKRINKEKIKILNT